MCFLFFKEGKEQEGHNDFKFIKKGIDDMKRVMILSVLVLLLAPMAWAQEKCEAPIWNIGDKWTYKDVTGSTFTSQVVRIEEDLFIVKTEGAQYLSGYDKKTLNSKFQIEESGRKIKNTTNYRKIFDFPIFVGKKWTYTSTGRAAGIAGYEEVTYINDFIIEGIEDITTPAGTFKAYRIHYKQTNMGLGISGWMRRWYSPEAKTWVKREFEKVSFWSLVPSRDAELISYELK
jgi:hypothetical protein